MSDLLVSTAVVLLVLSAAAAVRRSVAKRQRLEVLARLGSKYMSEPAPRRALFEAPAHRFARTALGAKVASYAADHHPSIPFSDVVVWIITSFIAGALAGLVLTGAAALSVLAGLGAPFVLDRVVRRAAGRRSARLEVQLPEAIALQASALRAGRSVLGSLRLVAQRVRAPLSNELLHTLREVELRGDADSALGELAHRTASDDVELWMTALQVHRVTGGDLPRVLDALSRRLRTRMGIRAEVRALTAQGRLSGLVVAAAPFGFFLLLSFTARDQMRFLFATPAGFVLLLAGLTLQLAGFLWIRKILDIKP